MTPHLPDVRAELMAAARRQAAPRRRALPRNTVALGVVAGLGVAGVASAVVLSSRQVDPSIAAHLAVLQRDRVPSDDSGAVGDATEALLKRGQAAVAASGAPDRLSRFDFAQTRRVRSLEPAFNLWLAPDQDFGQACLIEQIDDSAIAQTGPCLDRNHVTTGSSPTTRAFGHHVDVFGIVPDGVKVATVTLQDGTAHRVSIQDNVYAARFSSATRSVSYQTADGPVNFPAPSG